VRRNRLVGSAGRGRDFSLKNRPDRLWGPASSLLSGQGVKQPGREVDHSPPFTSEVKNGWGFTFAPPICLHDMQKRLLSVVQQRSIAVCAVNVDIYLD
jgi:hypothetical protein